jgi:hypothetical protein
MQKRDGSEQSETEIQRQVVGISQGELSAQTVNQAYVLSAQQPSAEGIEQSGDGVARAAAGQGQQKKPKAPS